MLYEDITNYSNIGLEIGAGLSTISCHEDLCCQLNYSMSCTNGVCDQYKLLSYSGFRTLGGGIYTVYIQVRESHISLVIMLKVKLTTLLI